MSVLDHPYEREEWQDSQMRIEWKDRHNGQRGQLSVLVRSVWNKSQEIRMKQKYLWLAVTPDKYELPLVIEDSSEKLGKVYGLSKKTVASMVRRGADGKRNGHKFVKVRIDDE